MNAFGCRAPFLYLVGVGVAACSAAGGANSQARGDGLGQEPAPSAQMGMDQSDDQHMPPSHAPNSDSPISNVDDTSGQCRCGVQVPGIDIGQSDGGISIVVDLPNDGSIKIETETGSVVTSDAGVEVKGDVLIDLGGGMPVALLDADLHIAAGVDGGAPRISGGANVTGSLLGETCGCQHETLPATVSLVVDVSALIGSSADAALELELDLPKLSIAAGGLISMRGNVALSDTHITLSTDGVRDVLKIEGDVSGNGEIWTSLVPLRSEGRLWATATLIDDALSSIELNGNVSLSGGTLWCGLTALAAVAMQDAKVTLERTGAKLDAMTTAAIHPSFSLDGTAMVHGEFSQGDWSLNVCGAVMTNLLDINADVVTCLDLTKNGMQPCSI